MKLYFNFLDNEKDPQPQGLRVFLLINYAPATTETATFAVTAWPSETLTV